MSNTGIEGVQNSEIEVILVEVNKRRGTFLVPRNLFGLS